MGQVMRPPRLSRTRQVPGLRIGAADPFMGPPIVSLDLFYTLFPPFADLRCQPLQPLFLVGIQFFLVDAGFLNDLHQLFRRAGGIGSDMG